MSESLQVWLYDDHVADIRGTRAFFRGHLPEGDALRAMAAAAGTTVMDTFTMLRGFGRDGAQTLGPRPNWQTW